MICTTLFARPVVAGLLAAALAAGETPSPEMVAAADRPGATLTALGFQTVLSSFFVSVLGMKRR